MENQSSSQIINDLKSEDIADNSAVARIVTALIASFALLSFVFILWYAYTEGKKEGLANLGLANLGQDISSSPSSQRENDQLVNSQNNVAALNRSDDNQNLFPNQSFGNDFAEQKQDRGSTLPRDPTQPIALSSPNEYKSEPTVPPPPSLTQDNQSLVENIKQVAVKSKETTYSTETVKQTSQSSSTSSDASLALDTATETSPDEGHKTNPTSTLSKKSEYGYIVGEGFADQWRIQLASLKSLDKANEFWKTTKEGYPVLLGGLKLQIEKVLINRNNKKDDFFRVKAGPFLSRNEATKACDSFKQNKIDCLIVKPS